MLCRLLCAAVLVVCSAAPPGRAALDAFLRWKSAATNKQLKWDEALEKYRAKLKSDGLSEQAAERTIRLVVAYDEAELYDRVYTDPPRFNTNPNRLLVEATRDLSPGKALDVAMGQGRNSIYLAGKGWDVTGFDVAEAGLRKARERAAALGLRINAVLAADEEFDFGRNRWDLIAIIYALEKRSVLKVREALKPGGIVVLEGGGPFEYQPGELPKIFDGFRILRYEDTLGEHDFSENRNERARLVRLVAQRPN